MDYATLSRPVDLVAGEPSCQPFSIGGRHFGPGDGRTAVMRTSGRPGARWASRPWPRINYSTRQFDVRSLRFREEVEPTMPAVLQSPKLIDRPERPRPVLEIGFDYIADERGGDYRSGWLEALQRFMAQIVQKERFEGAATIWNYCAISVNLLTEGRHPARSMFHVGVGLPDRMLLRLEGHLALRFGQENVRTSEYAVVRREDGWQPVCHIEGGRAWTCVGEDEWQAVEPSARSGAERDGGAAETLAIQLPEGAENGEMEDEEKAEKPFPYGGRGKVKMQSGGASSFAGGASREPDDLACLVRAVFSECGTLNDERAITELARRLDYNRVGKHIRVRMERALRAAVRRGILERSREGLTLATRSIGDFDKDTLEAQFLASLGGRTWRERDEAALAFTRRLGFARQGATITKIAKATLRSLVRQGRLEQDDEGCIRRV